MKREKLANPWVFVAIGLMGIAIGTAIILTQTSILPVRQRLSVGSTSLMVVCAGIVFAGIGTVFALTGFSQTGIGSRLHAKVPTLFKVLNFIAALIGLIALASVATFAAFGPGPRAFAFTIPVIGNIFGAETLGRIFFGAISLILWGVIGVFVWMGFTHPIPGTATKSKNPLIIKSVPMMPSAALPMTSQPMPETIATDASTIAICNSTSA